VRDYHAEVASLRTTGRNGMHRYNNQDHSMLSAKYAVECLLDPARDRDALWEINAEEEYHEEVGRKVRERNTSHVFHAATMTRLPCNSCS
jgi:hypothetical protein